MNLKDLPTKRLVKLYRRLYERYSDSVFGLDFATLFFLSESAYHTMLEIQSIVNRRYCSGQTDFYIH